MTGFVLSFVFGYHSTRLWDLSILLPESGGHSLCRVLFHYMDTHHSTNDVWGVSRSCVSRTTLLRKFLSVSNDAHVCKFLQGRRPLKTSTFLYAHCSFVFSSLCVHLQSDLYFDTFYSLTLICLNVVVCIFWTLITLVGKCAANTSFEFVACVLFSSWYFSMNRNS